MNKTVGTFCIALLLLIPLTFQRLGVVRSATGEEETEYYIKSSVTYSSNGSSIWNFTEREDRSVGLFMNNSWQTVYLVNSTLLFETVENDTDGNKVAVLQFPKMLLDPGDNLNYTVTYRVVSKPRTFTEINENDSESFTVIPKELLTEKYIGAKGPWLINDTELQSLAYNLAGNETKTLTIVQDFVDWIAKNITYQPHQVPQYPNETLVEREGDCDDQAILLVTMCRILSIPAFLQIGAIYTASSELANTSYWEDHLTVVQKRIGWHGWAMVYIPPWGWLPVDLTYVFGGAHTLRSNPLNSIINAAVTWQGTIQYMNISQTDYVSSSVEARDFLITNRFYVYTEDEMIETIRQENLFGEGVEWLVPVVLIAAVALLLSSSFLIARRWKGREERPTEDKPATVTRR